MTGQAGLRARIADLLARAPQDAPAIEFNDVWTSWGELTRTSSQLDQLLSDRGVGPAGRIGVVLENRPEHLAVLLCLLATGRTVVTLSPLQPADRLARDLRAADPAAVVVSTRVLGQLVGTDASCELVVELGESGDVAISGSLPSHQNSDTASERAPEDGVALEMLTSGTTGPPKRVLLRDRQLDGAVRAAGLEPEPGTLLRPGTGIVSTPLVHIGGLWAAVAGLQAGRRIVLLEKFNVDGWVSAVERYAMKAAGLVPPALRAVLDADVPQERLASLRVVLCGTAPCPVELADAFLDRFGARVLMTYGATEFAGAVAGWTYDLHVKWWDQKKGSAGRAFPGVEMRIVDADGNVVPTGDQGHLELTSRQSPAGERWLRTSDLASLDSDGFLWITGRADDAIIRGGFKVHPEHVRKVLESHPAVREAAVAGLEDARLGQVPVAVVELAGPTEQVGLTAEDLLTWCRAELTPYEVPAQLLLTDALPRTPALKVSRTALLEMFRTVRDDEGAA